MAVTKLMLVTFDDGVDPKMIGSELKTAFNWNWRDVPGKRVFGVEDLYTDDEDGFDYVMNQIDEWNDMGDDERHEFTSARDETYG